ncbi:MAG: PhzF family phenazine biosynthesis protein [Flavobacteriaceae bacterium]|nr:PhzF family phenazine biosynthesis protein [Flavobacteriaceae bacterium]
MKLPIYQIDAFTNKVFGGNPACVVPLEKWIEDDILIKIAQENAVPETAFFVETENGFHLRWFTPEIEMDLCGHATLATAFVIKNFLSYFINEINFKTLSGNLKVTSSGDFFTLDFPTRHPVESDLPKIIKNALNIFPIQVFKSRDYLLIYNNQSDIENITVDPQILNQLDLKTGGIIVTAKGDSVDFVSRFFTPRASTFEDPVTGSAHCSLIPYWSKRLNKNQMKAIQLSKRKGELLCVNNNDRVLITGKAKIYSKGNIWI